MALPQDFELLDDYLANRLTGSEKEAFEAKMKADPELARELKFQQQLVEGIRSARAAELKTMLKNIPVSSIPTTQSSLFVKAGIGIIGAAVITVAVFYFNSKEESLPETPVLIQEPPSEEPVISRADDEPAEQTETTEQSSPSTQLKDKSEEQPVLAEPKTTPKTQATKPATPALDVYTPEESETTAPKMDAGEQVEIISKAFVTSSIVVETEKNDRKYSFHYMFRNKKLVLFGSFEENMYEILEFINGDRRTVFLYYQSNYYWLDLKQESPVPLTAIKDKTLLRKLKESRGN